MADEKNLDESQEEDVIAQEVEETATDAQDAQTEENATEEEVKEATEEEQTEDTEEQPEEEQKNETEEEAPADKKKWKRDKSKDKDKKDEQIAELNDKLLRQRAEFENFRRRSEKEKSQMFEAGAKSTLEKMLPIVDNFERGLAGMEESDDSFAQGMNMIYKQLLTFLNDVGVTPIETVGKEFDPQFHNAVMHVEDEAYGENEIVEEFQKGYMYRDSVLRHAMVKVAN